MTAQPSSTDNKAQETAVQIGPQIPPNLDGASDVLRDVIVGNPRQSMDRQKLAEMIPKNEAEWLAFIETLDEVKVTEVQAAIDQSPVSVEHDEIKGVAVYHVTPDEIAPRHEDHLFVHVHGGGYVANGYRAHLRRLPWLPADYSGDRDA